jgi:monooxygenase
VDGREGHRRRAVDPEVHLRHRARGGIDKKIRFGHKVVRAEWSSDTRRWTVTAERSDTGERVQIHGGLRLQLQRLLPLRRGLHAGLPGHGALRRAAHPPAAWPETLDYTGKRVLVIGSGATAVTLVPSMADEAAHVTMLQRSPTYVVTVPGRDPFATKVRQYLPEPAVYALTRWKNVAAQRMASTSLPSGGPRR